MATVMLLMQNKKVLRQNDADIAGRGDQKQKMDTLGIEPRASRMLSGCDTTTPCAQLLCLQKQTC